MPKFMVTLVQNYTRHATVFIEAASFEDAKKEGKRLADVDDAGEEETLRWSDPESDEPEVESAAEVE